MPRFLSLQQLFLICSDPSLTAATSPLLQQLQRLFLHCSNFLNCNISSLVADALCIMFDRRHWHLCVISVRSRMLMSVFFSRACCIEVELRNPHFGISIIAMTSYPKGPNYKLKLAHASLHFCLRFGLLGCPFLGGSFANRLVSRVLQQPGAARCCTFAHYFSFKTLDTDRSFFRGSICAGAREANIKARWIHIICVYACVCACHARYYVSLC